MSDGDDRDGVRPEAADRGGDADVSTGDADVSTIDRRACEPTMTTTQHTTPRPRHRTRTNR
ncbi:hypothetical protein [Halorubrum sp. DM2]|uniref:hypothetical protein n=1 Tax=Halorubrum sp. DM2 TaxID=2527867 RepID=UPI0024B68581|nr:hypothetical protein [Halorubrum sp. DM2]